MTMMRVLLLCVLWLPFVAMACDFPYYMQTNNTDRDWRSRIKEQFTEITLQLTVENNVMRTVSNDASVASHTRVCLQNAGADKYLVAHESNGQRGQRYTCVQFVRRSDNVVQLRVAELSNRMDLSLCDDNKLQLDDWIIVDKNHVQNDNVICAMQGGFSVRIYDRRRYEDVCDGYDGQVRVESECVKGEGLVFYFRHQSCVPGDVYMYSTQRTLCLANWQHGPYTFSLLRNEQKQYMWLMRFPTALQDSFVAYVFYDLVADVTVGTTQTVNYMRLDSVRDVALPVSSLCVDDYEVCNFYNRPCDSGAKMALACPRTCGLCNSTRPQQCVFGNRYHGQWYDSAKPGTLALTVNNTYLTTYTDTGYQERFYCIQWDQPASGSQNKHSSTMMMVSEFDNGCKPRYTCGSFMQQASSVLFMKISSGKPWPFTKTPEEKVDCSSFEFEKDKTLAPNMFKNDNFRLVYARTSNSVECALPEGLTNYAATFKDGTSCSASLMPSQRANGFTVQLNNCPQGRIALSYTCMESSRMMPSKNLVIVARASEEPDRIVCWVFPRRSERDSFFMLDPSQCNEGVHRKIRKGRVKAIVSFTKARRPKIAKPRPSMTPPPLVTVPPAASTTHKLSMDDRKSVEEGGAVFYPTHPATNDTMPTDATVTVAPFVVIAAVLFFLVFQIPCTCRS